MLGNGRDWINCGIIQFQARLEEQNRILPIKFEL